MAVFKCKMCGASLEVLPEATTATCEYCASQQTLPRLNDDKLERLYDRANHFRRNNEFDKAESVYEQILEEDTNDAEAYWSLVLCRYGIEYVEDPATHKRMPTVNRAQYTSIFDDDNYTSALKYADDAQRRIYEEEARAINEIQKGILEISQKEEPFDVFICYKETDDRGQRTRDSVYANELYHELTNEGFKVFYARITLEDKLGVAYEPYIFAALNSAKVMVVLGTRPEFFNAVWVKNEWSRFLALIKNGAKKALIPAYSGMDPYDLPAEFSHLQAQDMTKLGFMPDLVRGISKLVDKEKPQAAPVVTPVVTAAGGANVNALLTRVKIFIDNKDWENADLKCEAALDLEPENAKAYIYKTMIALRVRKEEQLLDSQTPLDQIASFRNALKYADAVTAERLAGYNAQVTARLEREEAERVARARAEYERKEAAERRQRSINQLGNARSNIENNIRSLVAQKERLEKSLADLDKNAKEQKTQKTQKRTLAIGTIAFVVIGFFWLVLMAVLDKPVLTASSFAIGMIVMMVLSFLLAKKRGVTTLIAVLIAYFSAGFACIVFAALILYDLSKGDQSADRPKLQAQLAQVDKQLNENRRSLSEVNQKLNKF